MSFNSAVQPTQTLCQQDFTLGTGGVITDAQIGGTNGGVVYQNFNSQTSKIIGVKGKVVAGTGVTSYQNVNVYVEVPSNASSATNGALLTIYSALGADRSTYTVFWVNTTYPGLSPC
jgi:hypothetical protein